MWIAFSSKTYLIKDKEYINEFSKHLAGLLEEVKKIEVLKETMEKEKADKLEEVIQDIYAVIEKIIEDMKNYLKK